MFFSRDLNPTSAKSMTFFSKINSSKNIPQAGPWLPARAANPNPTSRDDLLTFHLVFSSFPPSQHFHIVPVPGRLNFKQTLEKTTLRNKRKEDLIDLLTTSSTSAALRTLRTHGLLLGPEVVAIAKFVFGICSFALPAKNPSDW